jgi:transposase
MEKAKKAPKAFEPDEVNGWTGGRLASKRQPGAHVEPALEAVIQTPKLGARIMRCELTDREWAAIKPMLPNKPRGVPRVNDRRVLNGIFWVLRSGAPWRDLPDAFGPYTTCYNRFVRWRRAGVWATIMDALAGAHDAAVQMIDTSIVRVHQHGACITRNKRQSMGRSRGGLTSKIHNSRQTTSHSSSLGQLGYGSALMSPRPTCCMVHGIRDGGRRANTCNLAHPFGANAAEDGVRLVNEFDLQLADVCVHGHLILGDIVVEESAVARINFTRLAESRADAPDETTIELASCRAAAQHPAAIHHRNHSNDPRPGHAWRDVHLDELCDERECDVGSSNFETTDHLPYDLKIRHWDLFGGVVGIVGNNLHPGRCWRAQHL